MIFFFVNVISYAIEYRDRRATDRTLAHYAFSRCSPSVRSARCYGCRRRVSVPHRVTTHSLSLGRASPRRSHTLEPMKPRCRGRARHSQPPRSIRPLARSLSDRGVHFCPPISYQWPASCSADIFHGPRVVGWLSVPMTISDLETNDRTTNNGYAFFRDVPNGPVSTVPTVHYPYTFSSPRPPAPPPKPPRRRPLRRAASRPRTRTTVNRPLSKITSTTLRRSRMHEMSVFFFFPNLDEFCVSDASENFSVFFSFLLPLLIVHVTALGVTVSSATTNRRRRYRGP